jgi:rare lipoprotein A
MIAQAAPPANAPRQAIALRTYEPDDEAYSPPARTSQPAGSGAVASNVPLPPERPFDLGTIPGAASPIARISSTAPASRPVVASLYETPAANAQSGFQRGGAYPSADASKFVVR